jgi:hypothetical protein
LAEHFARADVLNSLPLKKKILAMENIQQKLPLVVLFIKTFNLSKAPAAHSFNPSYSENRDQEVCGSEPAQANSLCDPILRTT